MDSTGRWGHVVFISLFFMIALTIFSTVLFAVWRTARDCLNHRALELCWESDFDELPESDRSCRHELAGRIVSRTCDNAFDCRHCSQYSEFAAMPSRRFAPDAGLQYSENRFYHRGHTWVEAQEDGTYAIGLDELADRLVGKPDSVTMPEVGSEIEINGTAWRMNKNQQDIRVRTPLEGTVIAVGGPTQGWYLKIRPRLDPSDPATLRHLLHGPEVRGWMFRELQRLQLQLRAPNTLPSLADGGVLVHGLMDAVPEADWDAVLADTFLAV